MAIAKREKDGQFDSSRKTFEGGVAEQNPGNREIARKTRRGG